MTDTEQLKAFCVEAGADLVGIAAMDRFRNAPKQMDPRQIFPDARALIVLAFRIPRGCLRGIEEGTFFAAYTAMGYEGINRVRQPAALWTICNHLEDRGYEAVPLPNTVWRWAHIDMTQGGDRPDWSRPVRPGRAAPDVLIHMRIAAVAAGLGEIGYSNLLLTPEFGPRQRLAAILTDMPLAPDPIRPQGVLCDRCKLCVSRCPAQAVHPRKTRTVELDGVTLEFAELDGAACYRTYTHPPPEFNPFFDSRKKLPIGTHTHSIGGARGCIIACMAHLEERGVLTRPFKQPFRRENHEAHAR
ncbi:MAG: epoxyqueuosine reductase [Kiritimatiellae bacterium]|nr:epoxyqueuosine reductase [Kiritimatiellia bacterium]